MDSEELKERYKGLPLWARFVLIFLLAVIPGAYIYFDESETIESQYTVALEEQNAAQAKVDQAIARKKKIPEIEARLMELEDQLGKAKKALPDSFKIEDILQKTAMIAKETGVKINRFNPEQEIPGKGEYKYMEMSVATEIAGKFNQIASFFDRLVHLEQSLFIKNIQLSSVFSGNFEENINQSDHQRAMLARQSVSGKAVFKIVLFRSVNSTDALNMPKSVENDSQNAGNQDSSEKK